MRDFKSKQNIVPIFQKQVNLNGRMILKLTERDTEKS